MEKALAAFYQGEDFDWEEHFSTLRDFVRVMTLQFQGLDMYGGMVQFFSEEEWANVTMSLMTMMDTMTEVPMESLEV